MGARRDEPILRDLPANPQWTNRPTLWVVTAVAAPKAKRGSIASLGSSWNAENASVGPPSRHSIQFGEEVNNGFGSFSVAEFQLGLIR